MSKNSKKPVPAPNTVTSQGVRDLNGLGPKRPRQPKTEASESANAPASLSDNMGWSVADDGQSLGRLARH
jgi:hypothetical protein